MAKVMVMLQALRSTTSFFSSYSLLFRSFERFTLYAKHLYFFGHDDCSLSTTNDNDDENNDSGQFCVLLSTPKHFIYPANKKINKHMAKRKRNLYKYNASKWPANILCARSLASISNERISTIWFFCFGPI